MTYAELTDLLQDYLQNTSAEFVAAIPGIVRLAEDRIYQTVQLPALRKNSTAPLLAGSKYLALPGDFMAPYTLAVIAANGTYTFTLERAVSFIAEAFPDPTVTGSPRFYALFNDATLLLAPTPTTGLIAELHYFYKPESIVTAGTSWLGDNCESVLAYGCLVEAYVYMKGEADLQALYRARYDEAMSRLKNLGEGMSKRDSFRMDLPKIAPT